MQARGQAWRELAVARMLNRGGEACTHRGSVATARHGQGRRPTRSV